MHWVFMVGISLLGSGWCSGYKIVCNYDGKVDISAEVINQIGCGYLINNEGVIVNKALSNYSNNVTRIMRTLNCMNSSIQLYYGLNLCDEIGDFIPDITNDEYMSIIENAIKLLTAKQYDGLYVKICDTENNSSKLLLKENIFKKIQSSSKLQLLVSMYEDRNKTQFAPYLASVNWWILLWKYVHPGSGYSEYVNEYYYNALLNLDDMKRNGLMPVYLVFGDYSTDYLTLSDACQRFDDKSLIEKAIKDSVREGKFGGLAGVFIDRLDWDDLNNYCQKGLFSRNILTYLTQREN